MTLMGVGVGMTLMGVGVGMTLTGVGVGMALMGVGETTDVVIIFSNPTNSSDIFISCCCNIFTSC
jgi:hypothetical protein